MNQLPLKLGASTLVVAAALFSTLPGVARATAIYDGSLQLSLVAVAQGDVEAQFMPFAPPPVVIEEGNGVADGLVVTLPRGLRQVVVAPENVPDVGVAAPGFTREELLQETTLVTANAVASGTASPGEFASSSITLDFEVLTDVAESLSFNLLYDAQLAVSVDDPFNESAEVGIELRVWLGDEILASVVELVDSESVLDGNFSDSLQFDIGDVSPQDFSLLAVSVELFGDAVSLQQVPEPLTALMLPIGLLSLGASRLARRSKE